MFPLYDESFPSRKLPLITISLILVNIFVFLFTYFNPNFEGIILKYGAIPARILKEKAIFTLITSMFLHGGFLHLIGNMWFFWLFGDNVEKNLGKIKFLLFYFLSGILAGLFHIFLVSGKESMLPVIGASGAISGVLGGYLILYPKNKIRAFLCFISGQLFFLSRPIFTLAFGFYINFYLLAPFLRSPISPTSAASFPE